MFHLPQPAWPKTQDSRMNNMTPQMFNMHLTCEIKELDSIDQDLLKHFLWQV